MAKKVLLTGAFGNIGSLVIRELLSQGYEVVAFDKESPVTRKNSRVFSGTGIHICWGDITVKANIEAALKGVDAVIHLAGIFPPLSENNPKLSQAVNVDGTRHMVEAMESSATAKRLVFASSIAVYGKQQGRIPPPLKASDAPAPSDFYGKHKAECETIIQGSTLRWSILRISACPPINVANMGSFKDAPIFDSHPDSRVEVIHPADTALAFVNAVDCDAATGKILLLGGGAKNQLTIQQLFSTMVGSIGLKPIPREAFHLQEPVDFHGDWLDTEESQRLLRFQRYSVQKLHEDFWDSLGPAKHGLKLVKPIAPLVNWAITRSSPYYRRQKK